MKKKTDLLTCTVITSQRINIYTLINKQVNRYECNLLAYNPDGSNNVSLCVSEEEKIHIRWNMTKENYIKQRWEKKMMENKRNKRL